MNLADFRSRLPSLEGLSDQQALSYLHQRYAPDVPIDAIASRLGIAAEPPPVEERSAIRGLGDLGIEAVSGVARGVKFTADAFGANNAVSSAAGTVDEFAREYLSAEAKNDDQKIASIMAAAENAGIWDQVKAAAQAFAQAPVRMAVNALGTSVPTIAATMIPGVGQAGAAARLGMLGTMGGVQGAGVVKGSIYERVLAEKMQAGMAPEQAEAEAVQAQEYGGANTDNIMGGVGLGAAASMTGAQPILARLMQGKAAAQAAAQAAAAKAAERGILARTGMGIAAEAPLEAAQGGQEQFAGNVALQREGFEVPTWRGVAGNAALEGLAAAPVGGIAGAIDRPGAPPIVDPNEATRRLGEAQTVDEMVKAAEDLAMAPLTPTRPVEFDANGVEIPPGTKPRARNETAIGEIRQLDPADQQEALGLLATAQNPKASGPVRRYAMNRLDEMLLPIRQIPTGDVTEDEALPVGDAQELTMPEASGQILEPPERGQMLKPGQRIPRATATELTAEEIELGQLPVGEAIEVGGERPEGMAERTGSRDGQELSLSGRASVMQYVNRMRQTNTPAARAFVQDFEAGRITPAEVMELIVPTRQAEATPDERIAAAAAQAPTILPTDLLTADGFPYGSRSAAAVRATREGAGEVVQVPGGFVVRTQESPREPVRNLAGTAGVAVPAGDAGGAVTGGGGGNLGSLPAGDGGRDAPAAAPVPGGGTAAAVGDRAGAGETLTDLKAQWTAAVKAGDTAGAAAINERIVALKAATPLKDRVEAKKAAPKFDPQGLKPGTPEYEAAFDAWTKQRDGAKADESRNRQRSENQAAIDKRNAWRKRVRDWFLAAQDGDTITDTGTGTRYKVSVKKRATGQTIKSLVAVDENGSPLTDGRAATGIGVVDGRVDGLDDASLDQDTGSTTPETAGASLAASLGMLLESGDAATSSAAPKPADPLTAAPVAESPSPRDRDSGDGGVATTRAGSEPQPAPVPRETPLAERVEAKKNRNVVPAGLTVTFGGKTYPVESVEDAQAKWIAFRDQSGAGGSQIGNGVRVVDGAGRFVARVSYNGRIWDTEDDFKGGGRVVAEAPDAPAAPETALPAAASAPVPEQPAAPKAKRPPKSFVKKVKVTTDVFVEETGKFEQQEIDADTALKALDADITELEKFRLCLKG